MKIGMFHSGTYPTHPRIYNEARTLIEQKHEVYLFCHSADKSEKKYELIAGIHVVRLNFSKLLHKLTALAYTVPFYHLLLKKRIEQFLEIHHIEAIHIHNIQIARSVFWANHKKIPVILDLHENLPEIMKEYPHLKSFLGRLFINPKTWKKHEFSYIKKANKVLTVTELANDYYLKNTQEKKEKFIALPNTVRKDFAKNYSVEKKILDRYQNHFTLLYLGDLGERRGLLTVLKSLKKIIPVIPSIKLVLVGNSSEEYLLKEYSLSNKLDQYVDFEGWKDFSLFQSYIKASSIGLCPIHKNIHHNTTYANKLFQYMAFGKPIIASNCDAQEHLINTHRCGLIFEDKNSDDFAKKVIRIYKDSEFYNELSKNALQSIQNELSWELLSKKMVDYYQELSMKQ
jgi:glycosyltransferase involved in cell wall biosynthesis